MRLRFLPIYLALTVCVACGGNKDNDELAHHHDHSHSHAESDHHDHDRHHDHETDHHDHEADHHDHDTNHDDHDADHPGEISLDPEMAASFGIETEIVTPAPFHQTICVSGQILSTPSSSSVISAPTSGIVSFKSSISVGSKVAPGTSIASISADGVSGGDTNRQAKAALDAAQREFDRVAPLFAEGIVTIKIYNDAVAALEQAKAAYSASAASGVAKSSRAGVITALLVTDGCFVEAGTPLASVADNMSVTLQADVPQRLYAQVPTVNSAIIDAPYLQSPVNISEFEARLVSASSATSSSGYIPVYFSLNNDGRLLPGSYVKVNLIGADRQNVITVPSTAISEQQGKYFVYQKIDDDCYRKLPVTTGASDGIRTEIISGLLGGEDIVTAGVVAVRLAESSNVVPEGHSHNH